MKRIILIAFTALLPSILNQAMAFDCKNTESLQHEWQKKVCANSSLKILNSELQYGYIKCPQLLKSNEDWEIRIRDKWNIKGIKEKYNERLDQIKVCKGETKFYYRSEYSTGWPNLKFERDKDNKNIPIQWATLIIDNYTTQRTIFEYPLLIARNENETKINDAINAIAKKALDEALFCNTSLPSPGSVI